MDAETLLLGGPGAVLVLINMLVTAGPPGPDEREAQARMPTEGNA